MQKKTKHSAEVMLIELWRSHTPPLNLNPTQHICMSPWLSNSCELESAGVSLQDPMTSSAPRHQDWIRAAKTWASCSYMLCRGLECRPKFGNPCLSSPQVAHHFAKSGVGRAGQQSLLRCFQQLAQFPPPQTASFLIQKWPGTFEYLFAFVLFFLPAFLY